MVMGTKNEIYKENGFNDRYEYLASLSKEYGVELSIVGALAEVLGEDEDFDGLPVALEDCRMLQ